MVLKLEPAPTRSHRDGLHAQVLPPRPPAVLRWLAGLALVVLACAASIAVHRCRDRELQDMPADERRVLFDRSLELLLSTCRHAALAPAYALDERCRAHAAFLQRFPECRAACHALTDPLTPSAIR